MAKAIEYSIKPIIRTFYKKIKIKIYFINNYLLNTLILNKIVNWKSTYKDKIKSIIEANWGTKYNE
jgi:hypothetical protein